MPSVHSAPDPRGAPVASPARLAVAAALAALLALGCGGGGGRRAKPAAPAVWSDPAALAGLDLGELDGLREAGVGELFVEAVRLEAGAAGAPAAALTPGLSPPRPLPATLVVAGDGPLAAPGESPAAAARRLGEGLRAAALGAERTGLIPLGFHFAPQRPPGGGGSPGEAELFAALRREVDPRLYLSVEIDRRRIEEPAARRLAAAADFVVAFLYGRRPGEPDEADAWDLDAVEREARAMDALGRDFWVGVVTLGAATVVDAEGPAAPVLGASLGRLAADPALALSRALALERGSRRVTVFEAERATQVGDVPVAAGRQVRAVRPGPQDLIELSQRLSRLRLAHYRGELFYRLPQPGEGLSIPAAALAALVRGEEPAPGLAVELTPRGGGGGRQVFTVTVTNRGALPTGVALLDHNYVEVTARGGAITGVDPGGFHRYSLLAGGREAANMREVRSADAARLFVPVLDAGEAVTSGPISARGSAGGTPVVVAGGRFVLAGGGVYDLPPVVAP